MRSAPIAVKSLLASGVPVWIADLYTVELYTGDILRFCTFDQSLTYGGDTWLPGLPVVTTKGWSLKNQMDVPEWRLEIGSSSDDQLPYNLRLAATAGLLDGAQWTIQRAVMPTPADTSLGLIDMWSGTTGDVGVNAVGVDVTVLAGTISVQRYAPVNRYSAKCIWRLYGGGCGLSRSAWTTDAVSVGSGSTALTINTSGVWTVGVTAHSVEDLVFGTVTILTGAAAGQSRTITGGVTGSSIKLLTPLSIVPSSGDQMSAVLGCDHTQGAQGCAKFSNLQHYRGFKNIPPAELGF